MNDVLPVFARVNVPDMNRLPVTAGFAQGVSEHFAVIGEVVSAESHRPVFAEAVRVEEDLFDGSLLFLPPVNNGLILEALFAAVKEAPGDDGGHAGFIVVLEFAEPLEEGGTFRQFGEVIAGQFGFRLDP